MGRKHDGDIAWSGWQELTLSADESSCPTDTTGTTQPPTTVVAGDYDADNDGLIEIRTLAQLDVIRYDLDGDNRISSADEGAYYSAFPDAITGMGCPFDGCIGFELAANLDFDTNGNRHADAGAAYWNDVNGWQPIAVRSPTKFTATFDGGGHTIANLYTRGTGNIYNRTGLFGSTGAGSDIRGVGLVSASVTGNSSVGGLVGHNDLGHITDSYVTGSVSGGRSVGGLVEYNTGPITDSYFNGNVNGSHKYAGGLVGWNTSPGRITGSHATGRVSGDYTVGGLAGNIHDSTITDSYAIGSVIGGSSGGLVGESTYGIGDLISASYWDTQTTGQTSSSGGEDSAGKTTAELQTPTSASGIYATWDPDVWDFGTSSQYPVLKAEGLSVADQR